MLKEHVFTTPMVETTNPTVKLINIVYVEGVREEENNSFGCQKQQGLSFYFSICSTCQRLWILCTLKVFI